MAERSRGRPRDEASTEGILDATVEVIAERGYHDATIDEIVGRAGASKATVYRRWPTKSGLVAAAAVHALADANPRVPHSDDATADVRSILENTIRLSRARFGPFVAALLGVAESDEELAAALVRVDEERRAVLREAVIRAGSEEPELDVDLLLGAVYFRRLFRRKRIDSRLAESLVHRLFGCAR